MTQRNNERFILFKLFDIYCISTGAHTQPCTITIVDVSYQEPRGSSLLMSLTSFRLEGECSVHGGGDFKDFKLDFLTFHDRLHVVEQTVDDLHRLRCGHTRFLHGEAI